MWRADIPFVLAVKPSEVVWTPASPEPESPWEAAERLALGNRQNPRHPGVWTAVVRRFHDGHEETWWAVDLRLGGTYGPDRTHRLVVATSDPRTLPKASTWYLVTNLPLPDTTRARDHPDAASRRSAGSGAALWLTAVGGAGLQAGQAGVGLGRLPGAVRSRHPSPLGAGLLRLLLLLVGREPARPHARRCRAALPAPSPPPRPGVGSGGEIGPTRPTRHPARPHQPHLPTPRDRRPGLGRCATCRAGLIPGASCSAAGRRGRTPRPHRPLQALLDAVTSGQPLYLYLRL